MHYFISYLLSITVTLSYFDSYAKSSEILDDEDVDKSFITDDFVLNVHNKCNIQDPFEKFNRAMYGINKGLDTIILNPVAHLYRKSVPEYGRDRVDDVLDNMKEPINILNSIFQLSPDKFSHSVGRFLVNSILGLGGLFDVAGQANIEKVSEDFGKTLGYYGVNTGPYIYLPIIGPSSPRDLFGRAVDTFSDPYLYILQNDAVYIRNGIKIVNTRESLIEVLDNIEKTSIDEYATIRSIYSQKRKVIE